MKGERNSIDGVKTQQKEIVNRSGYKSESESEGEVEKPKSKARSKVRSESESESEVEKPKSKARFKVRSESESESEVEKPKSKAKSKVRSESESESEVKKNKSKAKSKVRSESESESEVKKPKSKAKSKVKSESESESEVEKPKSKAKSKVRGESESESEVEKPKSKARSNKKGETALHIAIEKGNLELAKILVVGGENVNAEMRNDITPLHILVDKKDPKFDEFILFLLEHGADPNRKRADSKNHPTLLHKLVSTDPINISLIQNLLKYGACPFVKNELGRTVMNMVFKNRDLFVSILNSTKYVYIEQLEIKKDTIIFNKLITSLLYKSKRHEWNSKVCDNIRQCLTLLNPKYKNATEKQFKDYIEAQESEKKTFFGSYLSDGDKSDSDEETAYRKKERRRRLRIKSSALKILEHGKVKLLSDRQKIHHEHGLDKKISEDLEILNGLVKKGASISEAVKQIDTKFYIAQYRGIGYFTNKWNQLARRSHRCSNEINKPQYSASVLFGASNTHSFSEFYKLKDNLTEQQTVELENDIVKWGNILKEKVLNLRSTEKYIYNEYTYDNLAELLQDVYTKNYTKFEKLLRESAFIKHYLLNEHMPFVSTGDVPYHALKYAYGTKYYSRNKKDKGYKEERLRPRWQKNGKAERPYSGKVYISLHPLEDFDESGPLHLVSLNTKGKVNIDNITIPERESTFPAFLPENRVFFQHIAKYPSFHKPYKKIFLDKYGFTSEKYKNFQQKFYAAKPHSDEMRDFKKKLGKHLCTYYEVKLIEIARKKVEGSKKKEGLDVILIYRDEYGFFNLELPPDTVMRNNKKVVMEQRKLTKSSRKYRESLAKDEIKISKTGITRPPKKDYDAGFKVFKYGDFDSFHQKVLEGNVREVEALYFPDFYIHQTFTYDGGKGFTTLLHEVVTRDAIAMVKYLLGKGAFCNIRDTDGNTPLHLAVNRNNKEIIQLLVRYDADSGILNNKNQTPKDIALAQKRFDLIFCMLRHDEKDSIIDKLLMNQGTCSFDLLFNTRPEDLSTKKPYLASSQDISSPLFFSYSRLMPLKNAFVQRGNVSYQYLEADMACVIRLYKKLSIFLEGELLDVISDFNNSKPVERLSQAAQLKKNIFGIFNLGNWHWTTFCIVYEVDTTPILLYKDSKGSDASEAFIKALKNVFGEKISIRYNRQTEQVDGTSCGIFALENMRIMAKMLCNKEKKEKHAYIENFSENAVFCDQNKAGSLRGRKFAEARVLGEYDSIMDDALDRLREPIREHHQAEAEQIATLLRSHISAAIIIPLGIVVLGSNMIMEREKSGIGIEIFVLPGTINANGYQYKYRLRVVRIPKDSIIIALNLKDNTYQIKDVEENTYIIDIDNDALGLEKKSLFELKAPAPNVMRLCSNLGIDNNPEEQELVRDILLKKYPGIVLPLERHCEVQKVLIPFSANQRVALSKKHGDIVKEILEKIGLEAGSSYDAGDCFFDSVAQGLEKANIKIHGDVKHSGLKKIRMICNQYIKDKNNKGWVKTAMNKDVLGGQDYDTCCTTIQFTHEEIEKMKKDDPALNRWLATWGRPHIEGKIICNQIKNIRLHIIEFLEDEHTQQLIPNPQHLLVDGQDSKTVAEKSINYEDKTIIHLVVYRNHYVPCTTHLKKIVNFALVEPLAFQHEQPALDITQPVNAVGEKLPASSSPENTVTSTLALLERKLNKVVTSSFQESENPSNKEILTSVVGSYENTDSIANVVWSMIKKQKGITQEEAEIFDNGFRDMLNNEIIKMGIENKNKGEITSILQEKWGILIYACIEYAQSLNKNRLQPVAPPESFIPNSAPLIFSPSGSPRSVHIHTRVVATNLEPTNVEELLMPVAAGQGGSEGMLKAKPERR